MHDVEDNVWSPELQTAVEPLVLHVWSEHGLGNIELAVVRDYVKQMRYGACPRVLWCRW